MAIEHRPAPCEGALAAGAGHEAARFRWYHKLAAFFYILFCFEIGVFLLTFPWLELWRDNFFSGLAPSWYAVWNSPYLRGAVSGLGVVNIGISFSELFRLRRFVRK